MSIPATTFLVRLDIPLNSGIRSWGRHAGRVVLYLLFSGLFLAPAAVSAGMLLNLVAFPFNLREGYGFAALAFALYCDTAP